MILIARETGKIETGFVLRIRLISSININSVPGEKKVAQPVNDICQIAKIQHFYHFFEKLDGLRVDYEISVEIKPAAQIQFICITSRRYLNET